MTQRQLKTPDTPNKQAVLSEFQSIVGESHVLTGQKAMTPYLEEWRGVWHGAALAVVRPASTQQVADVVACAVANSIKIIPQGGNTGLVGGQIAFDEEREIIVSLTRMNNILNLDAANNTITVEAGCVLHNVQEAATQGGRLFPLSLSSEGTAQIGGLLSTNAGGTAVLRYGSMRALVLGLEVVLADGHIWNGLTHLYKDNTGYDLKQLFLGAEGTLGIITAAVLRLYPQPRAMVTAFAALPSVSAALDFFTLGLEKSGGLVSAFELIPRIGLELTLRHHPESRAPCSTHTPWYTLVELSSGMESAALRSVMVSLLENALERGIIVDAAVADSLAQSEAFWRLRENMSEAQKREGASLKHDISVPLSYVPDFIDTTTKAVVDYLTGVRPVPFGHMGDGNIHFNLSQPENMQAADFLAMAPAFQTLVHDRVHAMGGSISAEHGIGLMKRDENIARKSDVEIDLMVRLKRALDPDGILNPGKIVPSQEET